MDMIFYRNILHNLLDICLGLMRSLIVDKVHVEEIHSKIVIGRSMCNLISKTKIIGQRIILGPKHMLDA